MNYRMILEQSRDLVDKIRQGPISAGLSRYLYLQDLGVSTLGSPTVQGKRQSFAQRSTQ